MNPELALSTPCSPHQLNSTANLLDLIRDTLSSTEASADTLRSRISPILLDRKLESCGEETTRVSQSELNRQLTDILIRIKSLNVFVIDTTDSVTL